MGKPPARVAGPDCSDILETSSLRRLLMIEKIKSPDGAHEYSIIHRGDTPPEKFQRDYWNLVQRALDEVFHSSVQSMGVLRKRMEKASADTQTAFYHADPFEVAADL